MRAISLDSHAGKTALFLSGWLVLVGAIAAGCATSSGSVLPGTKQGAKTKPHARLKMVQDTVEGELHLSVAPAISRTVVSKGYDIGATSTVEVGEPLVSVRKHTSRSKVIAAVVKRDFSVTCVAKRSAGSSSSETNTCIDVPYSKLTARAGDKLFVPGIVADRGLNDPVYLISVNVEGGVLYVLADDSGRILEDRNVAWRKGNTTVIDDVGLPLRYGVLDLPLPTTEPLFEYTQDDSLKEGPSRLNYDLVYRGTKRSGVGGSIELMYVEYSPFAGEVPLYTQELLFDLRQEIITFKEFRIKVIEADDQKITFSVEDDGTYDSLG